MNRLMAGGIALTVVGFAGYVLGIVRSYPGRAFSVTVVMAGITLMAIHRMDVGEPA